MIMFVDRQCGQSTNLCPRVGQKLLFSHWIWTKILILTLNASLKWTGVIDVSNVEKANGSKEYYNLGKGISPSGHSLSQSSCIFSSQSDEGSSMCKKKLPSKFS